MIITGVEILSGGSGFSVNDTFTVESSDVGGSDTILKVTSVDINGAVKKMVIIKYGVGHSIITSTLLFNGVSYNPNVPGTVSLITFDPDVKLVLRENTADPEAVAAFEEIDALFPNLLIPDFIKYVAHGFVTGDEIMYDVTNSTAIYPLVDGGRYHALKIDDDRFAIANRKDVPINLFWAGVTSTTVPDSYTYTRANVVDAEYLDSSHSFYKVSDDTLGLLFNVNGLKIRLSFGNLCKYPGYYLNDNNLLDTECYIQDSYYYQKFSYVTALNRSIDSYGVILKEILHPAGTKHFARYDIEEEATITFNGDVTIS